MPTYDELCDLENTHTIYEVAEDFEVTFPTVKRWEKKFGLKFRRDNNNIDKSNKRPSKEELETILDTHNANDVLCEYNITFETLLAWEKIYDIRFRRKREPKRPPKEELERFIEDGKFFQEIMSYYDVIPVVVLRWEEKYDIRFKRFVTREQPRFFK